MSVASKRGYSIQEVCEITGLGRTTVYESVRTGALASVVIAGERLVPAKALHTFMTAEVNAETVSGEAA